MLPGFFLGLIRALIQSVLLLNMSLLCGLLSSIKQIS